MSLAAQNVTADPTVELLAEMAAYGLSPGMIVWDGKLHRFADPEDRGRKKSGWYVAYPDAPATAVFGSWRSVPKVTWTARGGAAPYDATALREAWAARAREREQAEREAQDAAAAKAVEMWERARPATPDHPYLLAKGITSADGLRVLDGKLLIPMKGITPDSPLRSLQTIAPDGEKLFTFEGQISETRTTLMSGTLDKTGRIYVCEGWATGWSIHHATGAPVVVAFTAGNLRAIAVEMRRRYPDAQLVIAADNDRWSSIHWEGSKERVRNPGVLYARAAAEAAGALLAVPDFAELGACGEPGHDRKTCDLPHPTDFNDLQLREGAGAVLRCLEAAAPVSAAAAPAAAEAPAAAPKRRREAAPPADRADQGTWVDSAPFRCLGYDRGPVYYYLPRASGIIVPLSSSAHDRKTLQPLAPLAWWETHFPHSSKKVDWDVARDALFAASHAQGPFRPDRLHGRGCWREPEGVVVHLGDRLLPPDGSEPLDPEGYHDARGSIYERQPRLNGPHEQAMGLDDAQTVLWLFESLKWHEEASGVLAAGWTVLAPVCGALRWRPHIWIVGGAGSGKSTIMRDLILPLLGGAPEHGGMARYFEGGSTEAGIRQRLRADSLPVLYDEAEKTDLKSDARIQSVLGLARSASSNEGAQTAKGTMHGEAMSFHIRSMFCLASIGGAVRQEADKSRISLLQLLGKGAVDAEERRAHWKAYAPHLARVNPEMGRMLFARTLQWLRDGRLQATIDTFRGAASAVLGDQRSGDQYGTLFAGSWVLRADVPPTEEEARALIADHGLETYIAEQAPEGRRALEIILQQLERIETKDGGKTLSIGELVDICTGSNGEAGDQEARRALARRGLKVDLIDGQWVLLVAHGGNWITTVLAETPYGDNPWAALRTLPGVERGGQVRFHSGLSCKTTVVPLYLMEELA